VCNSQRKQALNRLDELIVASLKQCNLLKLFGLPTVREDELLFCFLDLHRKIAGCQYLQRGSYKKRSTNFDWLLEEEGYDSLDESKFRFHFRMTWVAFWELVSLIGEHPAFQRKNSDSRGAAPKPASHQLLVLLKYYGSHGNQSSSLALSKFFGVGKGIINSCWGNAVIALLTLEEKTYIWPDAVKRRATSNRIKAKYKFQHCIGLSDGTLLPLGLQPLLHGENYLSCKNFYAIVMLVVCEDFSRIMYYHIGWPGLVHDN
jgi:hypothetical protein